MPFAGIEDFLKRYQAKAPQIGGMDALGFFVPPFAYANRTGSGAGRHRGRDSRRPAEARRLPQGARFKTIVGEIRYAPNGEWTVPRVL